MLHRVSLVVRFLVLVFYLTCNKYNCFLDLIWYCTMSDNQKSYTVLCLKKVVVSLYIKFCSELSHSWQIINIGQFAFLRYENIFTLGCNQKIFPELKHNLKEALGSGKYQCAKIHFFFISNNRPYCDETWHVTTVDDKHQFTSAHFKLNVFCCLCQYPLVENIQIGLH